MTTTKEPAWCPVHQHHKWCGHNGGVLTAKGWQAPPLPVESRAPAAHEGKPQ